MFLWLLVTRVWLHSKKKDFFSLDYTNARALTHTHVNTRSFANTWITMMFIRRRVAACICTTTKIFFFFVFKKEFIFFFDDDDDETSTPKTWRNHEFKSFVFPKRCHHEQRGANPNETHGRTESGVHFQLQNLRWWR